MLSDVEKANLKPRKAWTENIEIINRRLSRAKWARRKAVRMHHHYDQTHCWDLQFSHHRASSELPSAL